VSAVYNSGTTALTITFDSPLATGSLSDNELRLRGVGIGVSNRKNGAQAHAGGLAVVFTTTTAGGIPSGSPQVSYQQTSAELVGTNGLPVLAFTDFPMTIV
jgi:hypothetical protein